MFLILFSCILIDWERTKPYYSSKRPETFRRVGKKNWGMKSNVKKCYILSIRNKLNYMFYSLDDSILKNVTSNPYLGLKIAQDLKWHIHISNITTKANRTLGFLQRNLQHCPLDCRRTAYLSLVRSKLEYSATVWDSHYKTDIEKLERIQHRAWLQDISKTKDQEKLAP